MANIHLIARIYEEAPFEMQTHLEEFFEMVVALGRSFGHRVEIQSYSQLTRAREPRDLIVAMPFSETSWVRQELDAAAERRTPAVVFWPDHLRIPDWLRKNPQVVGIMRWYRLGAAFEHLRTFFGQYQGGRMTH